MTNTPGTVNPIPGVMKMDMHVAWQLFVTTGAPEAYLLYNQLKRAEGSYVPDDPGPGHTGHSLQ